MSRKIGRVGSGGFESLLRETFRGEEIERTAWWQRAYPDPVEGEVENLEKFRRAAHMVARRHLRSPRWKFAGFTHEDLFQEAWLGVLIGLRSWHRRPPTCRSLLAWVIRNSDWHCSRARDQATSCNQRRHIPRYLPASDFDRVDAQLGASHPHTFEEILLRQRPDQHQPDLSLATLAVSILRSRDRHRLADILEARIFDGLTLEQIAGQIGCTRERVRQLECEAARQVLHAPAFVQEARLQWPNWTPPDADARHSNKPSAAKKRPAKKPLPPAEKKSAESLLAVMSHARRSGHLQHAAS